MPKIELKNIEMLSKKPDDPVYEQLESGVHHTPYEAETRFYNCIESGDTDRLGQIMENYMTQSIVVGRMSNNDLKQMQYFAVCCIALATRYAIKGGLSEITAFNLSDEYIQKIDSVTKAEDIPVFLSEKAFELTELVRSSSQKKAYPSTVKKAIYYIEAHLYEKICPKDVADFCGLSKDYMNTLFKKHTDTTIGAYITDAKLNEGKRLLLRGLSMSQTAYQLSFCSESYFAACYKKKFGIGWRESKLK